MKSFLITGANGDIGDAMGRIIRDAYPGAQCMGADCAGEWPARDTFPVVYDLPLASHPDYISALRTLVKDHGIDLVVLASEPEILRLSTDWALAQDLPLLMNRPEIIRPFCDKLDTATWLNAHGIDGVQTVRLEDAHPSAIPFIAKPRRGAGGHGVRLIDTAEEFTAVTSRKLVDYVAQGFLPDPQSEHTCAVIRSNGETRTLIMKRKLDGSMTVNIEIVDHPKISDLLQQISDSLPCDGVINVQLRVVDGAPKVFEINPRFSSTVIMRHILGFSDLIWAIEALEGMPLPKYKCPVGARVYRMAREVQVGNRSCRSDR